MLFVLLVLTFLVVSCQYTQRGKPQPVLAYTGTQGLVINFVPNYPPTVIYSSGNNEDSEHNVIVEIRNKGAYKTSGQLYLTGFDQNIIKITDTPRALPTIEGKSPLNLEGGYAQIQFPSTTTFWIDLPEGTDVYPVTLQATACYDYRTIATLSVCVDPDPYGVIRQKACVPFGANTGGGQGAPVAITSVQQESLPGKVIFKMTISNVGGGQVLDEGLSSQCTQRLKYAQQDIIRIVKAQLSGASGSCTPSVGQDLRMVNNQAQLTCTFNLPTGKLAYTTTLEVELAYGYMSSIFIPIQIKKIT